MDAKKRALKESERDRLKVQLARYDQVINEQGRKKAEAQARLTALEAELNAKE